jgi:hypothetical protein
MFTRAAGTGQRVEALRYMTFGYNFTRPRESLGEDGMALGCTVTNQGKCNQAGLRECTGWPTNTFPLLVQVHLLMTECSSSERLK